ncbi:MAG: hypothetical protein AAF919_04385 [Pseudomonadota bacterium]
MARLLIHIGSQKTGSTSIQTFLTTHPEKLQACRLNYVKAGRGPSAHNRVARILQANPQKCDRILARIVREVDGAPDDRHILSSEMFFSRGWARKFQHSLPEHMQRDAKVIVYLRRQDAFLEAMYKQVVKTGRFQGSPADYAAKKQRALRYSTVVDAFADVFGAEAITLIPYEKQQLHEGDSVLDFAARIGLAGIGRDDLAARRSNITLSREVSEILGLLARTTDANIAVLIRTLIENGGPDVRKSGDCYLISERREIMEGFAADNAALCARYRPDLSDLFDLSDLSATIPDAPLAADERMRRLQAAQLAVMTALGETHALEFRE